ncbi:hypothetical protein Pmar_PMAR000806 [Perkinsus marinus ATCC 50983]|uniref:NUA/TPR/MLP1-2-like domain-containing protein n=1 Tax=Perkinsus marinus (strain ATCC 50983 / TXsc) TaxID=423536 RepID=C5KXN8_PERM5|nr:hypothetical protein Pmar_PMAR000806 [Perkinsus marinus ATCC 50983]EER10762.1 hypothetical protein Pmar_PMAR000806 [Perkinsus marinus ATCC 50983]|eukprot:XP_002778967.1 hypothetical protein Pmar_PMAR000806 [Perkinsus marinus ATCC 50983]
MAPGNAAMDSRTCLAESVLTSLACFHRTAGIQHCMDKALRGSFAKKLAMIKPLLEVLAQQPSEERIEEVKGAYDVEVTMTGLGIGGGVVQNKKEAEDHRGAMTDLMRQLRAVEREGEVAKRSLKARLSKVKQEKENCIAKYEKMLEDRQKELEQQKKAFESQIDRATRQASSLSNKKSSVAKRSTDFKSQNEALKRELADAETQVKVLLKEIQSLRGGGHNRSACSTQPDGEFTRASLIYDSEVSAVIEAALNKPPMSQSVIVLEDASGMQSSNDSGGGRARSKTLIIEGERQPVTKRYRGGRAKQVTTAAPVFIPEGHSPPRKRPNWNRKGVAEATPVAERTRARKAVAAENAGSR